MILWAAGEAGRLLADLPARWQHTQEVAIHAWWAAVGLPRQEQELLVAAAYLHDVGYSAELVDTGFHPVDGARHLLRLGRPELASLVAHHSGAAVEARHRGLERELAQFPPPDGSVADALTYCDITTGPTGETVDPGPRLEEVLRRHGPDSVVARARLEARVDLYAAVVRTLRRVAAGRPTAEPLDVRSVRMACTTLLGFTGRLDSAEAVDTARRALADARGEQPHTLVCDLAMLDSLDRVGAAELTAAAQPPRVVLLDPPPGVRASLERYVPQEARRPVVVAGVAEALSMHCGCG
ncbi:hypothetical protein GCM10023225_28930 [Kineococcus glutinatus]|uniref:HD/PDEase domain-containing protein n=1 Tax=Kineococcus glutinatus TaxID=1070872 RepID=A0ABP9I6W3_9ACTN